MSKFLLSVLLFLTLYSLCIFESDLSAQPVAPAGTDYSAALKPLLRLQKDGIANAELFDQIGLAYYGQGQTGKAALWFLRSLRLNSAFSPAQNNLDYLRAHSLDRELFNPPAFLPHILNQAYNFFALNSLAWIVLFFLVLLVLCLHWLLHLPMGADKAVPVMWMVICAFIFLLFSTMLGFKYHNYLDSKQAVVLEPQLDGYAGPGGEYGRLFTVHAGLSVHISSVDKGWALVSLPNGAAGWIPLSAVERVKL